MVGSVFTMLGSFALGIVAGQLLHEEITRLGAVGIMFIGVAAFVMGQVRAMRRAQKDDEKKEQK